VKHPATPRGDVTRWQTSAPAAPLRFRRRYLYASPTMEGYLGNIVGISTCNDPARPREVGRWWMPGNGSRAAETPTWKGTHHRCHHPLRMAPLYTSYWQGGFVILDIEDMASRSSSPGSTGARIPVPTHSAVPVPFEINGRKILVVATRTCSICSRAAAFIWMVDITQRPSGAVRDLPEFDALDGSPQPRPPPAISRSRRSRHRGAGPPGSPTACASSTSAARARRASRGISCPIRRRRPRPPGQQRVFVDERGVIYLLDRVRGFHILERI